MNGNVNQADVTAILKNVYGWIVEDQVELTFYNKNVQSLSQNFEVNCDGNSPAILNEVPAFPTGLAEVFIKPTRHRYKSILYQCGWWRRQFDQGRFLRGSFRGDSDAA